MSRIQTSKMPPLAARQGADATAQPEAEPRARVAGSVWLWALLAVALARGALFVFVVPPWQHPDEPTHFEHIRLIAETGRLPEQRFVSLPLRREIAASMLAHGFWKGIEQPVLDDASLSTAGLSPIGIYTLTQPRLYYIVAAIWLWPWLGLPVEAQLVAVRLLGVLLNLSVVACGYAAARLVFPRRPVLAAGAAGFLVFQPELTDIMSAANNDALINALMAGFFLAGAVLYRRGWRWKAAAAGLLALAGGLVTKTTVVIPILSLPLAVVCYPWRRRTALIAGVAVALLVAAVLALAAAFFVAAPDSLRREAQLSIGRYFRVNLTDTWQAMFTGTGAVTYRAATNVVFRSFWVGFGWRHILLDPGWYWLPGLAMLGAGIGLAALAVRRVVAVAQGRAAPEAARTAGFLLYCAGATLVAWVISIVRSQAVQSLNRYHSHGRYAFVAIVPFALLLTAGLLGWAPERWQRRALWIYLAGLIAFDALAFWGYLVPFYYFSS